MVTDKGQLLTFFNNKWVAIELIGEGSYGKVYKAKKEEFGIEAFSAIKQIELPYSKSEINTLRTEGMTEVDIGKYYETSVRKWIEEIELMLIPEFKECENIVRIEDYEVVKKKDEIGWTINIRMEELTSLDKYELKYNLTDKDILKMAIDVLSALEVCEAKDVVHRDIKPENIFVNGRGVYKVGDFGVAKHVDKTLSNMSKKGTENYMAPELYQKKRGNRTVDIYSLGIMLYKYFNYNRLPFLPDYPSIITADSREEAIYKRIEGEEKMQPPRNASREISEVILKACNYYPKDRYQIAKELKKDLTQIYNDIKNPKILMDINIAKDEKKSTGEDIYNETISFYSQIQDNKTQENNQKQDKKVREIIVKVNEENVRKYIREQEELYSNKNETSKEKTEKQKRKEEKELNKIREVKDELQKNNKGIGTIWSLIDWIIVLILLGDGIVFFAGFANGLLIPVAIIIFFIVGYIWEKVDLFFYRKLIKIDNQKSQK